MSQYRFFFHNNTNSFNTTSIFHNVWNHYTIPDERPQILTWLSPLQPKLRHEGIQVSRVENVGEWVLETETFKSWCASSGESRPDKPVLFCFGDPGVGKTFIRYQGRISMGGYVLTSHNASSLVIDKLGDQARIQEVTVACFYFDFAVQMEQSPASMLGAVLRQVVVGLEKLPGEIAQAYGDEKHVIGGRGPQLTDIVTMLENTARLKRTFICIDALDECAAEYRAEILESLNRILQRSPGTRVFVTGRPHIEAEVRELLSRRVMALQITPRRDDIIRYLHRRLEKDTRPGAMDRSLKEDILKKIPEDVSEM